MLWLPLSLLCAFSVASADAGSKCLLSDWPAPAIVLVRLLVPGLLLSPLLLLQPWPALDGQFWAWLALAVPLELLAYTAYMRAISLSPLALTLPYLALTPVLATGVGWLLLDERVSGQGFAGILMVAAGTWTLNGHQAFAGGRLRLLAPLQAALKEPGSRLALLVACIYSVTAVVGKALLGHAPALLVGPLYFAVLGLTALVAAALWRPSLIALLYTRPGPVLLVGSFGALEALSHFSALQYVSTATMLAVKRTSLLMGMVYGAVLFRETRLRQHLAAGLMMVAGVALLLLG